MNFLNKLFKSTAPNSLIENPSLQRLVPKCKKWKIDTLFIVTRKNCPLCSQYNRKVYSLYGWNNKYPRLPDFLLKRNCPSCKVCIGASIYFPGVNSPIDNK